jgi:protein-disulfide isomerase
MKSSDSPFKNPMVISAIILAIGLVGGGYMFAGNGSASVIGQDAIEKGIEKYIAMQEQQAAEAQRKANEPQNVQGVSADDDAVLGNKNAPVTIVEFSDYQCPFCKKFADETLSKIKENYVSTGKVKFIYRDFPLISIHPMAVPAAMAAECAGDESDAKYYEFHDKLFANQTQLSSELFTKIAAEIGLNATNFANCMKNETHKDEVLKDMEDGKKLGVTGTPGTFVNGWAVKGAQPYEVFEKLIEQELAK